MFFYLSIKQYASVLIRFWFDFGASKKGDPYNDICYGYPAPPYRNVWGVKNLCGFDDGMIMVNSARIWLDGGFR